MAYERIWAFSFDNIYFPTTALDQTRWQLWSLKALLCGHLGGLVSGLWSVYSSSDSVTAGNGDGPGTDRWGAVYDGTKIVRGTGVGPVRSWIVLKSPSMGGVIFYLSIVFDGAADTSASLYMAKTAPAGGTNAARPTSADEWLVGTTASQWNAGTAPFVVARANISLSSVGDFVFFNTQVGQAVPSLGIMVVSPMAVDPSDTFPVFTYKNFASTAPGCFTSAAAGFSAVNSTQAARLSGGTAAFNGIMSSPASAGITTNPDMITGKTMTLPMWVMVNAAAAWHQRGRLPDMFITPGSSSGSLGAGGVLRDVSNNITHVQAGSLFFPANILPNFA